MYIVRWEFGIRFGHQKEVIQILRQWEFDVGQRIGFRAANIKLMQGALGASRSSIELETHVDSLSDLEAAWTDMAKNPAHVEAMKSLERFVVGATDTWRVYTVLPLFEGD
jgi:hypothetical protein